MNPAFYSVVWHNVSPATDPVHTFCLSEDGLENPDEEFAVLMPYSDSLYRSLIWRGIEYAVNMVHDDRGPYGKIVGIAYRGTKMGYATTTSYTTASHRK
jgi:hypothetical protein